MTRKHLFSVLGPLAFMLAFVTGCDSGRPVVTISGVVTYKGAPVTAGAIYLHSGDNQVAMGPIMDDGTFTATEVPVGDVRVSFQFKDTSTPGGAMYADGQKPKGVTSLPEKFTDPNKSELKYTITKSTKNLEVKIN